MITIDGVTYRNLEEQVRFNQQNINTSATAIAAETERAKAAEAANATNIAKNTVDITTNAANITIESDRISAVSSDLAAFETDVSNTYLPKATAASTYATIVNLNALGASVVKTSGDQVVNGIKTFGNDSQLTKVIFTAADDGGNHSKIIGKGAQVELGTGGKSIYVGKTDFSNANIYAFPDKDGTVSLTGDVSAISFDNNNPSIGGISFYGSKCKLPMVGNCSDSGVGLRSKNDDCSATGINAVAIGSGSTASNNGAIAIGQSPSATAAGSISVGLNSSSSNGDSIGIGDACKSSGSKSIAIGSGSQSTNGWAEALGAGANASGDHSVALGNVSLSSGNRAISIGSYSKVTANFSTAIGSSGGIDGSFNNINSSVTFDGVAYNTVLHMYSPSYLYFRNSTQSNTGTNLANVLTAYPTTAKSLQDYLDAKQNKLTAGTGIIIDSSNKISADVSTSVSAINYSNDNAALTGLALNGVNYKMAFPGNASGANSLAIGYDSTASTPGANAYGASAAVTGNYGIAIGTQCTASGVNALTIGINGIAKNDNDIAIGGNSVAQNGSNVALGVGSHAYGNNSISIGDSTFNNISNTVTFDTPGINRKLVVASSDNIIFRNANITNTDTTAHTPITAVYSSATTLTNLINTSASNSIASAVSTAKAYTDSAVSTAKAYTDSLVDSLVEQRGTELNTTGMYHTSVGNLPYALQIYTFPQMLIHSPIGFGGSGSISECTLGRGWLYGSNNEEEQEVSILSFNPLTISYTGGDLTTSLYDKFIYLHLTSLSKNI